jgi:hypothetical protein
MLFLLLGASPSSLSSADYPDPLEQVQSEGCSPLTGYAKIAAGEPRFAFSGERHDTWGTPAFHGSLACMLGSLGEQTLVAIEHSSIPGHAATRKESGQIQYRIGTPVCASVSVEPILWGEELDDANQNGLSIRLAYALWESLHVVAERQNRGSSVQLAETRGDFRGNPQGRSVACRTRNAIHVRLRYSMTPNGSPFRASWQVMQGATVVAGFKDRDVARDLKSGALPNFALSNPRRQAISIDTTSMAASIVSSWNSDL